MLDGRALRITIRDLRITAASGVEARRLADAIGPALEHAFAGLRAGTPGGPARRSRLADRAAVQITTAVAERLKGTS
jgi:hypothetical protein